MKSVLAIDEGTTGARALVIADDGRVLGRGYREIPQHFPQPGWVEHDPEDLWRASLDACREALAQAGVKPDCIGITNQRETVCVWDRKTGKPLHRAIVWQDRRTADRCAALAQLPDGKTIRERTGLVLDPYFSGTKIEWLISQVPGVRGQVSGGEAVFGTVDSWILFRLTHGKTFATDHTNACRTLLYNITDLGWDDRLLGIFGVPRHALADVRASSGDLRGDRRSLRVRDPDPGAGRGSAGGTVWSGVLDGGAGEEHVRDGRVSAAQHRHHAGAFEPGPSDDRRV